MPRPDSLEDPGNVTTAMLNLAELRINRVAAAIMTEATHLCAVRVEQGLALEHRSVNAVGITGMESIQ